MELWLMIATALEYGVLVLLFCLSIWSIAIMIDRRRSLNRQKRVEDLTEVQAFISRGDLDAVREWIENHPGVHAGTLKVALESSTSTSADDSERVDRAVRSFLMRERLNLEKGLPVLATLGANAPFIGLFGTVLGIIRAFAALGGSASMGAASSVMSGISQALVATAAGLFVAIPAVVAFNAYSNRLRAMLSQCESLKDLYLSGDLSRGLSSRSLSSDGRNAPGGRS